MASGFGWKVEILHRLQQRDRQEFVSFKDLIKSRMSYFCYRVFSFLICIQYHAKFVVTVELTQLTNKNKSNASMMYIRD